jgi:hypothetical protein
MEGKGTSFTRAAKWLRKNGALAPEVSLFSQPVLPSRSPPDPQVRASAAGLPHVAKLNNFLVMFTFSVSLREPHGRATEFHEIIYNLSFIQNIGKLWVGFFFYRSN